MMTKAELNRIFPGFGMSPTGTSDKDFEETFMAFGRLEELHPETKVEKQKTETLRQLILEQSIDMKNDKKLVFYTNPETGCTQLGIRIR